MKKIILSALILILILLTLICIVGFRQEIMAGEPLAFLRAPGEAAATTESSATPLPTAAPSPTPTPPPIEEDPAQNAQMAWEALFSYPSHEAPVRVLALFTKAGSPGDTLYRQMLAQGKLMKKGVYYADGDGETKAWAAEALAAVPVGLLDSIYAETPALALAAYEALREADRNDSVEVICAGITEEIIAAMREDHFSMGAAAGVYENELRVVYAEEFMAKE